ncbi:hypothetical protein CW705_02760 [Candidatus Bathyarchaeota archaeon]|nr:MAG: hypothetical protein CW705_02760 [Candidatus Bathyarchaeota archaeon]
MTEAQVEEYNVLKDEPDVLEAYMRHLNKRVKRDEVTKRMVFLTGLSAYSNNPINLFLRGPSSIGKTYNVTQTGEGDYFRVGDPQNLQRILNKLGGDGR